MLDLLTWAGFFLGGFGTAWIVYPWLKNRKCITPKQWKEDHVLGITAPRSKQKKSDPPSLKPVPKSARGKWIGGVWVPPAGFE